MIKRFWKKFLIFLISAVALAMATTQVIIACGGGEWFEEFQSFFAPEVSKSKKYQPFYSSPRLFYNDEFQWDYVTRFDTVNVEEWSGFFEYRVKQQDLFYLLYKARLGEIDTLIFFVKNSAYPINAALKNNSVNKHENKAAVKEFLFFLGFAKRCSKVSTNPKGWSEEELEETDNLKPVAEELLKGGLKQIRNVKNPFIRERYFFQLTRLYFFSGAYNNCLDYTLAQQDSFKFSTSLKYRSLSYAAGAAKRDGKTAMGNYLYSIVYDKYDPLKQTVFLNFGPKEEKDWQDAVAMAKNTREKTVLWHLLGIQNDELRAMKEIHTLDPKSDLLDVLLTRSISETEANALPLFSGIYYPDSTGYKVKRYKVDKELLQFISSVAEKSNTAQPYLWNLSAAYLYTLAGESKKAEAFLSKAKAQVAGDQLAEEQVRIINIVTQVETYYPTVKKEAEILKELLWLKDEKGRSPQLRNLNVYNWALHRLAEVYEVVGERHKAYCLDHTISQEYLEDNQFLDYHIAFLRNANKGDFDNFIANLYPHSIGTLRDMQGVNLLYQYKLKEAKEKFLLAGSKLLESDPFTIRIKDCRDCDQSEYNGDWNSIKFIDEMLALEEKVKTNPNNVHELYFKLANGYYNMTYFGNCRSLFINNAFDPGLIGFDDYSGGRTKNQRLLDCSLAEENYTKALNATANPELKAKYTFMAAKCEQNERYRTSGVDWKHSIRSGKYFNALKQQYASTKYYQEILKECGYFKTYVGKK